MQILLTVAAVSQVWAQTAPDAGRLLQELTPPLELPQTSKGLDIETRKPALSQPGGEKATLKSVTFKGATLYSDDALHEILGDIEGNAYDLSGLKNLADQITNFYHNEGYPFARAILPPQDLSDGELRIEIIEGRYGLVKTEGEADDAEAAQDFLSSLHSGDVIDSNELERSTLILSDQPGIKAAPIIRPGQELGTGDLNVQISRERAYKADIGGDNFGNRYSGEYRAHANLQIDSPFLFGDQIDLKSLGTDEAMWLGAISYSLPIGASGLRTQITYYQTDYNLGKQFDTLDATGYAKVSSLGLSYPLVRSQPYNVTVAGTLQHKDLEDKQGSANTRSTKTSDSMPVSAQFDVRDGFNGGGITYGVLSWTHGRLNLDGSQRETDVATAKTNGMFDKFNLDVARLQKLPEDFILFGRFSGQWATGNLDSSEGFGLGGNNGVRAYPVGEAYGDEGWLAQVELRYNLNAFSPYIFYDMGRVAINTNTWDASKNTRSIAGPGFGLRFNYEGWSVETSLAWRTQGGKPESDTMDRSPRAWFATNYKF